MRWMRHFIKQWVHPQCHARMQHDYGHPKREALTMFTTVRLGSEFYNSECRRQGGRWRSRTELVSEGGSSRRGSRDRRSSRSSVELTAIRNSTGRGQGGEEAAALLAGAARRGDGGGWRRAVDSEGERTAEGFGSSARITEETKRIGNWATSAIAHIPFPAHTSPGPIAH